MASYQDQMSGGHATGDGEADLSSHRAHYKRKKTVKDKVRGLVSLAIVCMIILLRQSRIRLA